MLIMHQNINKINKKLDHRFSFLSFNFWLIALLETYALKHTGNLTPQRHEDGEEDGCGVVKEVRGSGGATGRAEPPEVAGSVTQGTHSEIETLITHLLAEGETLRHNWQNIYMWHFCLLESIDWVHILNPYLYYAGTWNPVLLRTGTFFLEYFTFFLMTKI